MRLTTIAIACVALAGCATPPPRIKPPPVVVDTQAPRCADQKRCEAMWLQAQETISNITGMRLRIVTDSRVETFAPTRYGLMGGVIIKYPVADGYEIRASFECYRGELDCENSRNAGLNLFNLMVGPKSTALPPASKPATAPPPVDANAGAAPPAQPSGRDVVVAEKLARELGCATRDTVGKLLGKGPGQETYSFQCANGETLVLRCEFGNCRPLR